MVGEGAIWGEVEGDVVYSESVEEGTRKRAGATVAAVDDYF